MYFENFAHMYYDFVREDGTVDYVLLKDITQNARFKRDVLQNIILFESYDMRETDTPEIVSERFYGSPFYHWVIMLANDRYDYINDFPLPSLQLDTYIKEKYGISNIYNVHHYEYNGFIVDEDYDSDFGVTIDSVSNYDYEISVNESKRRIKIISPQLLETVLADFRRII